MATNIALSRFEDPSEPLVSPSLAAEYKRAHLEMLSAMQAMDALALGPPPDLLRLSHARLRLTRAANESRAALRRILNAVSKLRSPTLSSQVQLIEQHHVELREAARSHMAKWSHSAAQAGWREYCQSHFGLAKRWREMIELERKVLDPVI